MTKHEILEHFAKHLVREVYDAALWPVEAYLDGELKDSDDYAVLERACKSDAERSMLFARIAAEEVMHKLLHMVSTDDDRVRFLFRYVDYDEETDEISESSEWLDLGAAFSGELEGLVVGDEGNWLVKYSEYPSVSAELSRKERLRSHESGMPTSPEEDGKA